MGSRYDRLIGHTIITNTFWLSRAEPLLLSFRGTSNLCEQNAM
jgi:hypothetical protein